MLGFSGQRTGPQLPVSSFPSTCSEYVGLLRRHACALGRLLNRLLETVHADGVSHLPLGAMQADTRSEYKRSMSFLEVSDDGQHEASVANETRGHRGRLLQRLLKLRGKVRLALGIQKGFGMGHLNERLEPKAGLTDEFRAKLEAAFADERALREQFVAEAADGAANSHPNAADEKVHP